MNFILEKKIPFASPFCNKNEKFGRNSSESCSFTVRITFTRILLNFVPCTAYIDGERGREIIRGKKTKSDDKSWISMLLYRGIFGSVTSHNHKLFYCTVWSTKMIHTIRFTPIKPNWKKWQTQTIYTKMTIQIEEFVAVERAKKNVLWLVESMCQWCEVFTVNANEWQRQWVNQYPCY